MAKPQEVSHWYVVDAEGKPGRLASQIAHILRENISRFTRPR